MFAIFSVYPLIIHHTLATLVENINPACEKPGHRSVSDQTLAFVISLCRSALRPPLPPLHMSQRLYSAAMSWVRLRSTISTYSRRQTLQNNQISDLAEHLQTKPKDGASAVGEKSPVIFYNPSTDVKSIQHKSLSSYLNIINV